MKYIVSANYNRYCFDKTEDAMAFAVMAKTCMIDRHDYGVNVSISILTDEEADDLKKKEEED